MEKEMKKDRKAGIIGATGYAGAELLRILAGHPHITELFLSSVSYEGEFIQNIYPNFWGNSENLGKIDGEKGKLLKAEAIIEKADIIFSSLPHGAGEDFAKACVEKGKPFIDLSADFRFGADEETFSAWYGKGYRYPELRQFSVYGLCELNRQAIKTLKEKSESGAAIIGNPGCYPTAATLGAYPALAKGLVGEGVIIVDAASGVTGGGREPKREYHYPECADNVSPYKVGAHRHTPEISGNFEKISGKIVPLIFTPHLAPVNRGILATIYLPLAEKRKTAFNGAAPRPPSPEIAAKTNEIRALYADFYHSDRFVRVLPAGTTASTNRVRGSNFCDISVHLDQSGSTLIIISAIDNMVKGAAGQAVQNMNIIAGFEESAGLTMIPAVF
jgi:N-acetyl-gamma-glutamyl-phosphate reductase